MKCFFFYFISQGNLEFEGEEESNIVNPKSAATISKLLGVTEEETVKALCSRVIAAGGKVVEKPLNVPEADFARKAFAKVNLNKCYLAIK